MATVVEVAADSPVRVALAQWFHDTVTVAVRDEQEQGAWRVLSAGELYRRIGAELAAQPSSTATVADVVADLPHVPTVDDGDDAVPVTGALQLAPDGGTALAWVTSADELVRPPVDEEPDPLDEPVIDLTEVVAQVASWRRGRAAHGPHRRRPPRPDPDVPGE